MLLESMIDLLGPPKTCPNAKGRHSLSQGDSSATACSPSCACTLPRLDVVLQRLAKTARQYRPGCLLKQQYDALHGWFGTEQVSAALAARRENLLSQLSHARTADDFLTIQRELYDLDSDETEARRRASLFDADLVNQRALELERAHHVNDVRALVELLRTGLSRDTGGIFFNHQELHHHPGARTEPTIKRYQKAIKNALDSIVFACRRKDKRLDREEVHLVLQGTLESYGRTALLLSGGGTMGMSHIGVVKALHDVGQLPDILCGSSAGAIICSILCTRLDSELPGVLQEFCHGDLAVFVGDHEMPGWTARIKHYMANRSLFDSSNLERVMKQHLGNMTFLESYTRTGKILNITVTGADIGKAETPHVVLNHKLYPNVMIWSAVVASCALPFAFKPAQLMARDPVTGVVAPERGLFIDGSVGGDIPMQYMASEFYCNNFIVAQANPHVLTCWTINDTFDTIRLGHVADLLRRMAIAELNMLIDSSGSKTLKVLAGIVTQQYSGNVTVVPPLTAEGLWRILTNPTPTFMESSKLVGERATWPFIKMIKNHTKIEIALEKACKDIEASSLMNTESERLGSSTAGAGSAPVEIARRTGE